MCSHTTTRLSLPPPPLGAAPTPLLLRRRPSSPADEEGEAVAATVVAKASLSGKRQPLAHTPGTPLRGGGGAGRVQRRVLGAHSHSTWRLQPTHTDDLSSYTATNYHFWE